MIWRTSRRVFTFDEHGVLMGILNVTPDSFSDGGSFSSVEKAVEHGLRLAAEGAEIIDVGGESTRPGAAAVPADEELRRVIPVIKSLASKTGAALSIDTSKASVARAAMEAGAEIINDVTALTGDPAMAEVAADSKAGVVLMHMRGTPCTMQLDTGYSDVVREVHAYLRSRLAAAIEAGIPGENLAVDPGIGFGKTPDQNLQLIASLGELAAGGRPVLLGASRKSFLGIIGVGNEPAERDAATAALTALGWSRGARIFRVHDVRGNASALRTAEAVGRAAR
jgi:dihydropteroate synthase